MRPKPCYPIEDVEKICWMEPTQEMLRILSLVVTMEENRYKPEEYKFVSDLIEKTYYGRLF